MLLQFEELEPQYVIFVDREKDRLDTMEVRVEASQPLYASGAEAVKEMAEKVKNAMRETLYVSAAVQVVEPGSIERSMGKARRVVDRRELG